MNLVIPQEKKELKIIVIGNNKKNKHYQYYGAFGAFESVFHAIPPFLFLSDH